MRYSLRSAQRPLRLTKRTITQSMQLGENAEKDVKICLNPMCEYGAVARCWAEDPKDRGSHHGVFLSFEWSMLSSRKILSYKHKLPVSGSVKLGKVAGRFKHFRMVYAI